MRGILFDKDGTLLDFEATWTPVLRRLALEAAGGDEAKATDLLEQGGLVAETGKFRAGSVIGAGTTELIVRLWHPGVAGDAFRNAVTAMDRAFLNHGSRNSVPIAGVAETIAALAERGHVMGVATNDAEAAAKAALAATGMARHLPHIFGYDSVAKSKPAPDLVLAFAKASGIPVSEIAVVGDNTHDLEMAHAAGALPIGVTSGNSSAADLAPLAHVVLPSVRELPAWLDQNRK